MTAGAHTLLSVLGIKKRNLLTQIVRYNNTDSQPSHQTSRNSLNESFVSSLDLSFLHFSSSGEGLKYLFIQFLAATMNIFIQILRENYRCPRTSNFIQPRTTYITKGVTLTIDWRMLLSQVVIDTRLSRACPACLVNLWRYDSTLYTTYRTHCHWFPTFRSKISIAWHRVKMPYHFMQELERCFVLPGRCRLEFFLKEWYPLFHSSHLKKRQKRTVKNEPDQRSIRLELKTFNCEWTKENNPWIITGLLFENVKVSL